LGIYVLPRDEQKAQELLTQRLSIKEPTLNGIEGGRVTHKTAHYRPDSKLIILPYTSFHNEWGENPLMHEVAHAIDFLYMGDGTLLCQHPGIFKALRIDKPLNGYCERMYERDKIPLEQFACSFCAYFQEPTENRSEVNDIDDLSPELIKFFNQIVKHFDG
jgi:hypothetical protein